MLESPSNPLKIHIVA